MRHLILVLGMILGGTAAVGGLLLGVLIGVLGILGAGAAGTGHVQLGAIALGVACCGIGCGISLFWAAGEAYRRAPSQGFAVPPWGWWLLAWVLSLGLGQWALSSGMSLLAPIFHVAAGVLPALLCLSLAIRSAPRQAERPSQRAMLGSLGWGALGATGLGIFLETAIVAASLVALVLILGAMDSPLLESLQRAMQEGAQRQLERDFSAWQPLLSSPLVIAALLILFAVVVPLIEEIAKALCVPLLVLAGRRPTRLDGFLLGVAAGAGFALVEGTLNGSLALISPPSWGRLMALRGAAAVMHCLASGLMGLGWQAALVDGAWKRALGLGCLSIVLHGLWNLVASAQTLVALGAGGAADPAAAASAACAGALGLIWVVSAGALALLPRHLTAA